MLHIQWQELLNLFPLDGVGYIDQMSQTAYQKERKKEKGSKKKERKKAAWLLFEFEFVVCQYDILSRTAKETVCSITSYNPDTL